jgi:hypothetical protein
MRGFRLGQALALSALVAAAALIAFVSPTSALGAEGTRVLDPLLSLVGGCSEEVEALDPVEDPGCPSTPPAGPHPAEKFAVPTAVATDFSGDMFVGSFGKSKSGSEGRIDVFSPQGAFITEIGPKGEGEIPPGHAPNALAIDSSGVLYAILKEPAGETTLARYTPTLYHPELGEIKYANSPVPVEIENGSQAVFAGIAINPADDHLFANFAYEGLREYSSAEEGNMQVRRTSLGFGVGVGMAVDAAHARLYASQESNQGNQIDIFDLNKVIGTPPNDEYELVGTIKGSAVPAGSFSASGYLSIAVDEGTGHVFVLDGDVNRLYEFDESGSYLATLERGFQAAPGAEIGLDNGPFSPNGSLSDRGRYLFVPSGRTGTGHSFAFEESQVRPPQVKSIAAANIAEGEAELQAEINPGNLLTSYTFEYTTQQSFEETGNSFAGAATAGSGLLVAGNLDAEVSAVAAGLQPGTQYRFRLVASNERGSDEAESSFSTYPSEPAEPVLCPNRPLRTGFSSTLPDCRAYELATPPDTNARTPVGTGRTGQYFTNRQVSPAGDKVPFRLEGGTLPEGGGTGSSLGDPYVSNRGAGGWTTSYIGPTGAETPAVTPGSTSPDQGYSFWATGPKGSASIEGRKTSYVRYPDGHSEFLGKGSLGTINPEATGTLISEGGSHIVFATGSAGSAVQLEPQAAPDGTQAIYDRTADGVTHVVSLLPGDVPLKANENAIYQGASLDGQGVAFRVGPTLYLRYEDSATFEIAEGVGFASVAEGGNRIFYVEGGRLWRFDALTGERTPFSTGTVTPVNVSADGSSAYFVSTAVLTTQRNPNNAKAKSGQPNLYFSREGAISFVGTLTARDVVGEPGPTETIDGLGLWVSAMEPPTPGRLGLDPSRSTPDGNALLFESRAPLAGYQPEGHAEIYRYDLAAEELQCISCNPTGLAAQGSASLFSERRGGLSLFYSQAWLANLRPDGRRAFFQSTEALVPGDTDGLQDVYEWEAEGVGSCSRPGGCVYLISSGHSSRDEYLWAVSESGDDVFFLSSNVLLPSDADETPSIYDARVGGGFPEPAEAECQGEGCRPQLTAPPALPPARTPVQGRGDNFHRRCPKGTKKVRRHAKVRCVRKKHRRRQAGAKGGVGRK